MLPPSATGRPFGSASASPRRSGGLHQDKRVATNLSTRHLRQVETYAVNEGVEYIILTNGSVWQVYHPTRESLKKRQIDEV
jgi:predicted type IV restriction endonuclease